MNFNFKEENGVLIVKPYCKILDFDFLLKIEKHFKNKPFALDCKNVQDFCGKKTVSFLIQKSVNLFNVSPFALLGISLLDTKNFINLYLNEKDFLQNKRKISRRRFKIV